MTIDLKFNESYTDSDLFIKLLEVSEPLLENILNSGFDKLNMLLMYRSVSIKGDSKNDAVFCTSEEVFIFVCFIIILMQTYNMKRVVHTNQFFIVDQNIDISTSGFFFFLIYYIF
jgi:hypothetical protein